MFLSPIDAHLAGFRNVKSGGGNMGRRNCEIRALIGVEEKY
jgi:hypothetical protein